MLIFIRDASRSSKLCNRFFSLASIAVSVSISIVDFHLESLVFCPAAPFFMRGKLRVIQRMTSQRQRRPNITDRCVATLCSTWHSHLADPSFTSNEYAQAVVEPVDFKCCFGRFSVADCRYGDGPVCGYSGDSNAKLSQDLVRAILSVCGHGFFLWWWLVLVLVVADFRPSLQSQFSQLRVTRLNNSRRFLFAFANGVNVPNKFLTSCLGR